MYEKTVNIGHDVLPQDTTYFWNVREQQPSDLLCSCGSNFQKHQEYWPCDIDPKLFTVEQ